MSIASMQKINALRYEVHPTRVFVRLGPILIFTCFAIWSKRVASHGAVIDAVSDFLDHCDVGFC